MTNCSGGNLNRAIRTWQKTALLGLWLCCVYMVVFATETQVWVSLRRVFQEQNNPCHHGSRRGTTQHRRPCCSGASHRNPEEIRWESVSTLWGCDFCHRYDNLDCVTHLSGNSCHYHFLYTHRPIRRRFLCGVGLWVNYVSFHMSVKSSFCIEVYFEMFLFFQHFKDVALLSCHVCFFLRKSTVTRLRSPSAAFPSLWVSFVGQGPLNVRILIRCFGCSEAFEVLHFGITVPLRAICLSVCRELASPLLSARLSAPSSSRLKLEIRQTDKQNISISVYRKILHIFLHDAGKALSPYPSFQLRASILLFLCMENGTNILQPIL